MLQNATSRFVRVNSEEGETTTQESEVRDWTIWKPDGTDKGNFGGEILDAYKP